MYLLVEGLHNLETQSLIEFDVLGRVVRGVRFLCAMVVVDLDERVYHSRFILVGLSDQVRAKYENTQFTEGL